MKRINRHRLFGLVLTDYLTPRGFHVETEKDLSSCRTSLLSSRQKERVFRKPEEIEMYLKKTKRKTRKNSACGRG